MKQKRKKMKSRSLLFLAFFLLTCAIEVYAQNITVRGIVKDDKGEPIIGATIKVEGNNLIGTISDLDGKFSLLVPNTTKQLVVNYLGMQSQQVNIIAGQPLDITLREDSEQLNEVVVIGYQAMKRRDLTGSVASLSAKNISSVPVANAAQALQGKLPGVNVVSQDGRPDASVAIRVRGGSSISQNNDPLILIDGVSGTLSDIPIDQIESIDVLFVATLT